MANLGAASIGGYMDFIKEMLGLREQRLQEERYQQLQQMENQRQALNIAGNIGQSLVSGAQTSQQNQMANELMGEYYGGSSGVSPDVSFGGAKSLVDQGLPMGSRRFTGGMPELEMRIKMMDMMSRMGDRTDRQDIAAQRLELANAGYDLRAQAAQRSAAQFEAAQRRGAYDDAMQSWKASSEDWQGQVKDVTAYNKELSLAVSDAEKAKDMESYNAAVSHINTLHQAAKNQGFKDLTPPPIPPSPDQRDAITAAQSILRTTEEERKLKMGDWYPDMFQKIPTAEELLQKQKEIQALPGYGYEPGNIPSTALRQNPPGPGPAPTLQQFGLPTGATAPGATASAPQRQQFRNTQTGAMEWFEYRNGQWVPVK